MRFSFIKNNLTIIFVFFVFAAYAQDRPNILFILADDMGWGDVGYHGSVIKTPTIDRLAREGLELDQHYVYPQCTPTRVGLLTGRYTTRYGMPRPINMQVLPYGVETMASVLKSSGYETCISGKWHLGSSPEYGPNHYGFDHSYGGLTGAIHPWTKEYSSRRNPEFRKNWHRNEQLIEEEGIHTQLTVKEAVNWLQERNDEKPWFLYLAFHAVHTPIDASEQYKQLYANTEFYENQKKQESKLRFAAMTTEMDDGIKKVLDYLEQTGQLKNTLVVFTSDNGGIVLKEGKTAGKYPEPALESHVLSSNSKLKGQKATLYEGGIRVPTVVYWKGKLEPGKIDEPIIITDWLPTFAYLAGYIEPPLKNLKWDGKNIWPILDGEIASLPDRPLYIRYIHNMIALRFGDWKLIKMSDTKFAHARMPGDDRSDRLYNIANDPFEENDLADEYPEIVDKLNEMVEKEMKIDMPMRDAYEPIPTLNSDIY